MLDVGAPSRLRFKLLGQPLLACGDATSVRISAQKGLALLAYLAMNKGAPISRAILADLLWSDRVDAQARQNLRQLILTLRRDLSPRHSALLQADDQSISLAAEAADVDAVQFEAWATDPDPDIRRRCLELPWGSFLDGFSVGAEAFDEWATAERHRLDAIAVRTFADLAARADSAGDGERAILALERMIAIDPAEEERHRRLLLLESRYRGPDAALARAKELAAMLKRELDTEREPATTALVEDIRRAANKERFADRCSPEAVLTKSTIARGGATRTWTADARNEENVTTQANVARDEKYDEREPAASRQPQVHHAIRLLAAIMLLVAGATAVSTMNDRPPDSDAGKRPEIVAPEAADSWKSPPLPSGRVAGGAPEQRKGTIPIVVLPFTTYDEAGSIRLLADMMTDDLTNMLSRVRYFRVISRQTARSYQRQQIDVAAMGQELGVRYVLQGSIRMLADKLRVTVELNATDTRTVAWSARIERENSDRHGVQDEIVGRLVRELQIGSYPIESARLSTDVDADALAYRGMAALQAAFSNISLEAYRRAEALFVQALEREPKNVMARLGLGSYHANVAVQRLVPDADDHLNKAREIIMAVIRETPRISGAHHQLGIILQGSGKLKEAIDAFEQALEINPSSAGSHAHIGFALARMGRASDGLEHIRYAMRLSPKDPSLAIWLEFAGSAELELDHYQEAIENFRHSIALTPAYPRPWAGLVAAQALAGDVEASRKSTDQLRTLAPNLTARELFRRFARLSAQCPRLQEGLRLALALAVHP